MNLNERKIINIFKTFIQRIFVPQLPKMQTTCQQEWNRFSSIISSDSINLSQIQLYVDTLPGGNSYTNKTNFDVNQVKPPFLSKIKKQTLQQNLNTFNPSKTFGGERARILIKDFEQSQGQNQGQGDRKGYNFSKDFSNDKQDGFGLTTQAIIPTLQKLYKTFSQNQTKMQKIGGSVINPIQSSSSYQYKPYYN